MTKKSQAAQEEIIRFWEDTAYDENKQILNQDEDYSLVEFLADKRFLSTSSKILYDFFCEKFDMPNATIKQLVEYLQKNYSDFVDNKRYKTNQWENWLTKGITPKARKQAFAIAVRFEMPYKDTFLKLLNSIDGESVHYRNPMDIIYDYSLRKGYSLEKAEQLFVDYNDMVKTYVETSNRNAQEMKLGETFSIQSYSNDKDLLDELISNYSQINKYTDQYSVSSAARFMRLVQYLWIKYPKYFDQNSMKEVVVPNFKSKKGDLEVGIFPDAKGLCTAIMDGCALSSTNMKAKLLDETKNYLLANFRKEVCEAEDAFSVFSELRSLFVDLKLRISQKCYILYGMTPDDRTDHTDRHFAYVKRSEVMLLLFFFIVSFLYDEDRKIIRTCDLPKVSGDDMLPKNLKDAMASDGTWASFDKVMEKVQEYIIDAVSYSQKEDKDQKQLLLKYFDIFNLVLMQFGFYNIYLPNLIDRYFMVCLLADEPDLVWNIDNMFAEK